MTNTPRTIWAGVDRPNLYRKRAMWIKAGSTPVIPRDWQEYTHTETLIKELHKMKYSQLEIDDEIGNEVRWEHRKSHNTALDTAIQKVRER